MTYKEAEQHLIWQQHVIGDQYIMDDTYGWKIAYYPIIENGEARALVERPAIFRVGKDKKGKYVERVGIDFREVPIYYLTKQ